MNRNHRSSSSSSSSAARLNGSGQHKGRRTLAKGKSSDTVKVGFNYSPVTIRAPATQTFMVAMHQNDFVLGQAASFSYQTYSFEMGNMNGGADYLAVFDSYRIVKVQAVIRPMITTGVATFVAPTVYTVVDLDDSNPLTTASAFREYGNSTETQYETITREFAPHANTAMFVTGGASSGYGSVRSPWCDAASVTIEHHGLKLGLDGGAGAVPQSVKVSFHFLVEWRCTR